MTGLFPTSIHAKTRETAHTARARAVYCPPKAALRHFLPSGEPTHLPASDPFCSRRTYLQGKIPQVTSPAEILTTAIDIISGSRVNKTSGSCRKEDFILNPLTAEGIYICKSRFWQNLKVQSLIKFKILLFLEFRGHPMRTSAECIRSMHILCLNW